MGEQQTKPDEGADIAHNARGTAKREAYRDAEPKIETQDDKAKRLADQAEGKPMDEYADRTGRFR